MIVFDCALEQSQEGWDSDFLQVCNQVPNLWELFSNFPSWSPVLRILRYALLSVSGWYLSAMQEQFFLLYILWRGWGTVSERADVIFKALFGNKGMSWIFWTSCLWRSLWCVWSSDKLLGFLFQVLQISQPFPCSQSKHWVMCLWGWWLFCGALNCSQLLFLKGCINCWNEYIYFLVIARYCLTCWYLDI